MSKRCAENATMKNFSCARKNNMKERGTLLLNSKNLIKGLRKKKRKRKHIESLFIQIKLSLCLKLLICPQENSRLINQRKDHQLN
jgi:hypothetical protein